MDLPTVLRSLHAARVQDVLVPGYIDRDQRPPRVVPVADTVYLDLDDGFLRLDVVGDHSGVKISRVSDVDVPAALRGAEFTVESIGTLLFHAGGGPYPITRIRYATTGGSTPDHAVVRCAEFQLGGHARLFADPMWMPGIRLAVGGRGYDDWQRDDRDRERKIFGSIDEFVWEP